MKSTIKQLLKFTAYTTVVALFFSCTPATGGSITGLGTDTGTGTTTTATTGDSTTDSGTDTGTGTTTGTTGGSSTGSGTGTGTGTTTGTSGVSFSTTYNDPTLPENIGTDPFKGHTYRNTYSNSYNSGDDTFTFGNTNELTYTCTSTYTTPSGTTTYREGKKNSYSYDATTKELSLKCTHILQQLPGSTESKWYTYAECINYLLNITRSQLAEMGAPNTYTDEQFKEMIQNTCIRVKNEFETTSIWKAELDTSNNLKLRTDYYKTAPSSLPNNSPHHVFYRSDSIINFNLSINPTTTDTSNSSSNESGSFLYSKGSINILSISAGTPTSKNFTITNITSNTISAVETTYSSAGHTIVSDGVTLELSYTYALGNDNNLLVTVTGSDDTTKDFLRTLLGDDTLTNPSITASSPTDTATTTYTFVE